MRNSSSLDWLRFMHTPNDYRVSHQKCFQIWRFCRFSFVRFIQDYEPQRQNSENVDGWREDDCEFLRSDDRGERSFYRGRERGDDSHHL